MTVVAPTKDKASTLLATFTATATGGVSSHVRETVTGLTELFDGTPVTPKQLEDHLGLAADTVWHRVQRAIELGLIFNLETRARQPAKLVS